MTRTGTPLPRPIKLPAEPLVKGSTTRVGIEPAIGSGKTPQVVSDGVDERVASKSQAVGVGIDPSAAKAVLADGLPSEAELQSKIDVYGALLLSDPATAATERDSLIAELTPFQTAHDAAPEGSKERQLLQAQIERITWRVLGVEAHAQVAMAANTQPVLAEFLKDAQDPKSILGRRLAGSEVPLQDVALFITTGQPTSAFTEALKSLSTRGDYPQLGLVISAQKARAAYLRAQADATAEPEQATALRKQAKAAEQTARALPEQAQQTELQYAGKLERKAADILSDPKASPEDKVRAQKKRDQALDIYVDVGNSLRERLAKKPDDKLSIQAARASAGAGRVLLGKGLESMSQAEARVASTFGPSLHPTLPPQLAKDRRVASQVAAAALAPTTKEQPAEAFFREAVALDPKLVDQPQFAATHRSLLEQRAGFLERDVQRRFPTPPPPVFGKTAVLVPKADPLLLADMQQDRVDLFAAVKRRENALDAKAATGPLTDSEWGERNQLTQQGNRVATTLELQEKGQRLEKAEQAGTLGSLAMAEQTAKELEKAQKDLAAARATRIANEAGQAIGVGAFSLLRDTPLDETADEKKQRESLETQLTQKKTEIAGLQEQVKYNNSTVASGDALAVQTPTHARPKDGYLSDRVAHRALIDSEIKVAAAAGKPLADATLVEHYDSAARLDLSLQRSGQFEESIVTKERDLAKTQWKLAHKQKVHMDEWEKIHDKANDRQNDYRREWGEQDQAAQAIGMEPIRTEGRDPIYLEKPANFDARYVFVGDEKARLDGGALTEREQRQIEIAASQRANQVRNEWTAANNAAGASGHKPLRYQRFEKVYVEKPADFDAGYRFTEAEKKRIAEISEENKDSVAILVSSSAGIQAGPAKIESARLAQRSAVDSAHAYAEQAAATRERLSLSATATDEQVSGFVKDGTALWSDIASSTAGVDSTRAAAALGKAEKLLLDPLVSSRVDQKTVALGHDYVAESAVIARKQAVRATGLDSGAKRGRAVVEFARIGERSNEALRTWSATASDPASQARVKARATYFTAALQPIAGFATSAEAGRVVARDGKAKFDKAVADALAYFDGRTKGSVSATSNAAMFVFSGGKNMRQLVRDADREAMKWAVSRGEHTARDYEAGYDTMALAERMSLETQYEFAALLHDPRAQDRGSEGFGAWRQDVDTFLESQGVSMTQADGAISAFENDPVLRTWRDGGALDDLSPLTELYKPELGAVMMGDAYDMLSSTIEVVSENHSTLESDTKWLLRGIDVGIMVLGGELLMPLSSGFAAVTGLARVSAGLRTGMVAAGWGARTAGFAAGTVEGLAMLGVSKLAHQGARLAGVSETSDWMALVDFGSGAIGFNVVGKSAWFAGLGEKYAISMFMASSADLAMAFGASQETAGLIAESMNVFAPAVFGAMGAHHTAKSADQHAQIALDLPAAREVLSSKPELRAKAESVLADKTFALARMDLDQAKGGLKERRALVQQKLLDAGIPKEAAAGLADADLLARAKQLTPPPKELSKLDENAPLELQGKVDTYYAALRDHLVAAGVPADRVRVMINTDKAALYQGAAASLPSRQPRIEDLAAPASAFAPSATHAPGASTQFAQHRMSRESGAVHVSYPKLAGDTWSVHALQGDQAVIIGSTGRKEKIPLTKLIDDNPWLILGNEVHIDGKKFLARSLADKGGVVLVSLDDLRSGVKPPHEKLVTSKDLVRKAAAQLPEIFDPPTVRISEGGKDAHGYKLLRVDGDRALVTDTNGGLLWVKKDAIVYDHAGRALGALSPLQQRRFEARLKHLSDHGPEAELAAWSRVLTDARALSPEHGSMIERLFANRRDLDSAKTMLEWARPLKQHELGAKISMRGLTQHMQDSCAPTAFQYGLGAMDPEYAKELTSGRVSVAKQQKARLEGAGGASKPRQDSSYVHNDRPPLLAGEATAAKPIQTRNGIAFFDVQDVNVGDVGRRVVDSFNAGEHIVLQVHDPATGRSSQVSASWDVNTRQVVFQRPDGSIWTAPFSTFTWGPKLKLGGNLDIELVGLSPTRAPEAQYGGMWINKDPELIHDLEVVTDSTYVRQGLGGVDGKEFVDHVIAAVADGYPVPVAVAWTGTTATAANGYHQLWVQEVRRQPGGSGLELFVYDPSFPTGRWIPAMQLLAVDSGNPQVIGRPYGALFPDHLQSLARKHPFNDNMDPIAHTRHTQPSAHEAALLANPRSVVGLEVSFRGQRVRIAEVNTTTGSYSLEPIAGGQRIPVPREVVAQLNAVTWHLELSQLGGVEKRIASAPDSVRDLEVQVEGRSYRVTSADERGHFFSVRTTEPPVAELIVGREVIAKAPALVQHFAYVDRDAKVASSVLARDHNAANAVTLRIDGADFVLDSMRRDGKYVFEDATDSARRVYFDRNELAARPEVRALLAPPSQAPKHGEIVNDVALPTAAKTADVPAPSPSAATVALSPPAATVPLSPLAATVPLSPLAAYIDSTPLPAHSARVYADPKAVRLPPRELLPNFAKVVDSYQSLAQQTPGDQTSKLDSKVYESNDGSLRYVFTQDAKGRASLVHVELTVDKSTPVDPFGMIAPLYERGDRIPFAFGGSDSDTMQSNWAYVSALPIIQHFYKAQKLKVPA